MNQRLVIGNVVIPGHPGSEILVESGRIRAISSGIDNAGGLVEDGGGALVLPGFVDAHAHLDKSLIGLPWHVHETGKTLRSMIDDERRLRTALGMDPEKQARRQIALGLSKGTTATRTHVDIDTEHGLAMLEGVMAARDAYREVQDVEIVAFPQSGCVSRPGTVELLDAALQNGADIVGGIDPCGIDRDPKGQLDAIFRLAGKHDKPIDIHLHEPGEMGAFDIEMIVERTQAMGLAGRVTISHAFCLGMPDRDRVRGLMDDLARLDIALATTAPPSRTVPLMADCIAHGVRLVAGSDGIRDTWSPYGNADMLERAMFLGLKNNLRADVELERALDVCTIHGATLMGLNGNGISEGSPADIVLVDARTVSEAIAQRPARRLVVSKGRIVARNGTVEPQWAAP